MDDFFYSANLKCSRDPCEEIYVSSTCLGNDERRVDIFGCRNISGAEKISNYSNILLIKKFFYCISVLFLYIY